MKKRALSLLLAALMLMSFAACRGSDSGSAASAAPATEAEATDESPDFYSFKRTKALSS